MTTVATLYNLHVHVGQALQCLLGFYGKFNLDGSTDGVSESQYC